MANFIHDTTENLKIAEDLNALSGAELLQSQKYQTAEDWNKIRTYLRDIRDAAREARFNVKDYGAVGLGDTDDDDAIAAAIAACAASSSARPYSGGKVFFPLGTYRHTRPVVVSSSFVTLEFEDKGSTRLVSPGYRGPAIIATQVKGTIPTSAPLVGSTGLSIDWAAANNEYWMDLRQSEYTWLDGHTGGLTFECFFRMETLPGQNRLFTSCYGKRFAHETAHETFTCGVAYDGAPYARLNVGGTVYQVAAPAILAGHTYYLAVTWNGTSLRIFTGEVGVDTNCTLRQTVAASGAISQKYYCTWSIGPQLGWWPDGGVNIGATAKTFSTHLMNVARYTATFPMPTARNTKQFNTVALLNGDTLSPFTATYAKAEGPVPLFMPYMITGGDFIGGLRLKNVTVDGQTGPFIQQAPNTSFEDLKVNSATGPAFWMRNSYFSTINGMNLHVTGNNHSFAAGLTSTSGGCAIRDVHSLVGNTKAAGLLLADCGGHINGAFLDCKGLPLLVTNNSQSEASFTGDNISINDEDVPDLTPQETSFAVDGVPSKLIGSTIMRARTTGATIWAAGNKPLVLEACRFGNRTGSTERVQFLGSRTAQVVVKEPAYTAGDGGIAWSSSAGLVVVCEGGSTTSVKGISATDTAAKNLRGTVTVTGTDTTGAVTFTSAETNSTYFLQFTPVSATGTPDAGSTRPASVAKTGSGFTLTVEAAPGSGNSVTFDWLLVR